MKDYIPWKWKTSRSALILYTKFKPSDKEISSELQSLKEYCSSKTIILAFVSINFMMIGRRQDKLESGIYLFMREFSKEKCSQVVGIMRDLSKILHILERWELFKTDWWNIDSLCKDVYLNKLQTVTNLISID